MYPVSANFHTLAVQDAPKTRVRIYFIDDTVDCTDDNDVQTNGTLLIGEAGDTDSNKRIGQNGITFNEMFNSEKNVQIGDAVSSQIGMTLLNTDGALDNFQYGRCKVYLDVYDTANTAWLSCPMGVYIIELPTKRKVQLVNAVGFDQMTKFDEICDTWWNGQNWSGGLTLLQIVQSMATQLGVSVSSNTASAIVNSSLSYTEPPFDCVQVTYREVLEYVAEATGTVARFDRDGALDLRWFEQAGDIETNTYTGNPVSFVGTSYTSVNSAVVPITPIQSGTGDPAPDNVRAISGRTGANVYVSPTENVADATTYAVAFGDAGTVYGGTVDVVSGVLTVNRAIVDLGALTWHKTTDAEYGTIIFWAANANLIKSTTVGTFAIPNAICSIYQPRKRYGNSSLIQSGLDGFNVNQDTVRVVDSTKASLSVADFKTAMNGVQLCYELATPVTYQLTPQQITALVGQNYMWSSIGGAITVGTDTINPITIDTDTVGNQCLSIDKAEYSVAQIDLLRAKFAKGDIGVTTGSGSNEYTIQNNLFLNGATTAAIQSKLADICTRLNALSAYYPISGRFIFDWSIEAGDIILVRQLSTNYTIPIFQNTMTWRGGYVVSNLISDGDKTRPVLDATERDYYRLDSDMRTIVIDAPRINLLGYTTINNGFKVNLDGTFEANGATINGKVVSDGTYDDVIVDDGLITFKDANDTTIAYLGDNGLGYAELSFIQPNARSYVAASGFKIKDANDNDKVNITGASADFNVPVSATGLTINGNAIKAITTGKQTVTASTVTAGSQGSCNIPIGISGYTPLGIISVEGEENSNLCLVQFSLTNSSTARLVYVNTGTVSRTPSWTVTILYTIN